MRQQSAPGFIRVFDALFVLVGNSMRVLFMLIGGGMLAGGFAMIVRVIRVHGQETQVEGSDSLISIRRLKRRRGLGERTFPRAAVTDIRSSFCGETSGIVSKRVQLIVAEKAETVASSIVAEQADTMVTEVRRALGIADHGT